MVPELVAAPVEEKPLLQRLLQLYLYEFSAHTGDDLGPHATYDYPYLDHYWVEAGRHPFLLRVDGKLAGFALVREPEGPGGRYALAEFFVLRAYRGRGLGAWMAHRLFRRFPGPWSLWAMGANEPAVAFWRRTLARFVGEGGHVAEESTPGEDAGILFRFESPVER